MKTLEHIAKIHAGIELIHFIGEDRFSDIYLFSLLSEHPLITMDVIQMYPTLPWDYEYLSINPNLTTDYLTKNLDKYWNWKHLSRHPMITFNFVITHIHYPWCWNYLTYHPNIDSHTIISNPQYDWDFSGSKPLYINEWERSSFIISIKVNDNVVHSISYLNNTYQNKLKNLNIRNQLILNRTRLRNKLKLGRWETLRNRKQQNMIS